MNIKAIEIKSIEYTQTFTDADLQRYLADPWQWREDVQAQLGLSKPANGNGHAPASKKGTARKTTGKRAAKRAAPKGATALKPCPHCDRTFKHQARLATHVRRVHSGASSSEAPAPAPAPTWQTAPAPAAE
jgi:hypothetical protein